MNTYRFGLGLLSLLFSANLWAAPVEREELCRMNMSDFQDLARQNHSQISFRNRGGLIGGGVCWWHSRLQRAAIYLSVFRPELPKPTRKASKAILNKLVSHQQVVEIPGYKNFKEFTRDQREVVQDFLENWQLEDGFIGQRWVAGISARLTLPAASFKKRMDELYKQVKEEGEIVYTMLQLSGIPSHAWLVTDMEKTGEGYRLEVLDSNDSGVRHHEYIEGSTHLRAYGKSMVHIWHNGDFKRIKTALNNYCQTVGGSEFLMQLSAED